VLTNYTNAPRSDFGIIDAGLNRAQGCIAFADRTREPLVTVGFLTALMKQRALQSFNGT